MCFLKNSFIFQKKLLTLISWSFLIAIIAFMYRKYAKTGRQAIGAYRPVFKFY